MNKNSYLIIIGLLLLGAILARTCVPSTQSIAITYGRGLRGLPINVVAFAALIACAIAVAIAFLLRRSHIG